MSQDTTPDTSSATSSPATPRYTITSVADFIAKIVQIKDEKGVETFYRGHASSKWELLPSIFRMPNGIEKEHLLFRDMVAHEPQNFLECKSALDYLVQMQHYGLPTRLLDMTLNPLVALYFACEKEVNKDGLVYHFAIPENKVKHYDSDTVSVLANLAKCKKEEVSLRLYPTCDLDASFYDGLKGCWNGQTKLKRERHEAVCIARGLSPDFFASLKSPDIVVSSKVCNNFLRQWIKETSAEPFGEDFLKAKDPYLKGKFFMDQLRKFMITNSPAHDANSSYLKWFNNQAGISLLLHQIRVEKPHFRPLIQAYDLVSMFCVKAKYGNQRITNQMGAFFLFGLGLQSEKGEDGHWGPLCCGKNVHTEIPQSWIKQELIIPKGEIKKSILKELAHLGITESYIYPGMEQYAKELKKKYKL